MSLIKNGITREHKLIALKHHTSPFTPDISKLEKYRSQLLFVCDEWMSDRRQHFVLDELGGQKMCVGFTMNRFRYLIYSGEQFFNEKIHWPLPIENGYGSLIKGEIIAMPPQSFLKLDKLKQNGRRYQRRRVRILYPNRDTIVFENTTEERGPHSTIRGGIDWKTGKFPQGHPLGGKKCWVGPERVDLLQTWMYVASPDWMGEAEKHPMCFDEVPRFTPKKEKRWLSDYYKYQNPEDS